MSQEYWELRYQNNETPWDIGHVSPSLSSYFQRITHKDIKILIPGAGKAYEAEWLWRNDFKNIWIVDLSPKAFQNFYDRCPDFPKEQMLVQDFFSLEDTFEIIIEQTFFCAIDPHLRKNYVRSCHQLLRPQGKLIGLLFDFPLTEQGPPFGGSKEEYLELFSEHFKIWKLEKSYNSIKPREGKEFFFQFIAR